MHRHHAYPIGNGTIYLTGAGRVTTQLSHDALCAVAFNQAGAAELTVMTSTPVYVNGTQVRQSVQLHPGDRVHGGAGDLEFQFIRVVNDYGQA